MNYPFAVCGICGRYLEAGENCPHTAEQNARVQLGFVTKDSGQRQEFSTGMHRDIQDDKPRYDLLDLPMLKRWAELMARGAKKYGENNWKKAETEEELARFKASAIRHLFQWLEEEESEDHSAAIMFNVAGAEMVKAKLKIVEIDKEKI